ncbi:MAG: formylglycine-generating enzyme family protein [Leptolyngbyaceae cyanobacterium bins.59]|nr:formylglycine-generating enzyme family protein [Leptolyngbyaceae cyanobacterium bins.59]
MTTGSPLPERRIIIARQKHRGQYFTEMLDESTRLDMMLIPGGSFLMGQTDEEKAELIRQVGEEKYQEYNYADEFPRHPVTVQPFFLGKYAITQAQWRVVATYSAVEQELDPDPSNFKGDNRPVEQVSWEDATEFCQRLSQKTGRTYRLPSEAEWEYACRAGTTTPFHFGETLSDELANYAAQDREINGTLYQGTYGRGIAGEYRQETTDVGSFPANPFGLYDMHGNVWEWCEDDYHDSYKGAPEDGSAWVDSDRSSTSRVLRGGSWCINPRNCRSALRVSFARDVRGNDIGFRVCCVAPRTLS